MKTRFITCACLAATLVIGSTVVLAKKPAQKSDGATQPSTTQKSLQARGDRLQQALAELNLTDAQKEQIELIQKETREKLQALRGSLKGLAPEERRAKVKEATGNIREKIAAILTNEQKAQLKEKLKSTRAAGGKKSKAL